MGITAERKCRGNCHFEWEMRLIDDFMCFFVNLASLSYELWFGCDVSKMFHHELGVLDMNLYDYSLIFGTDFKMDKNLPFHNEDFSG